MLFTISSFYIPSYCTYFCMLLSSPDGPINIATHHSFGHITFLLIQRKCRLGNQLSHSYDTCSILDNRTTVVSLGTFWPACHKCNYRTLNELLQTRICYLEMNCIKVLSLLPDQPGSILYVINASPEILDMKLHKQYSYFSFLLPIACFSYAHVFFHSYLLISLQGQLWATLLETEGGGRCSIGEEEKKGKTTNLSVL